jgi:hypothetical protein
MGIESPVKLARQAGRRKARELVNETADRQTVPVALRIVSVVRQSALSR